MTSRVAIGKACPPAKPHTTSPINTPRFVLERNPYSIWVDTAGNQLPYIDRIQMIVVERGEAQLGQWVHYRRDILKDYRRAFNEEPGDIVAVGVLTDGDNTQQTAHALYGDISFKSD